MYDISNRFPDGFHGNRAETVRKRYRGWRIMTTATIDRVSLSSLAFENVSTGKNYSERQLKNWILAIGLKPADVVKGGFIGSALAAVLADYYDEVICGGSGMTPSEFQNVYQVKIAAAAKSTGVNPRPAQVPDAMDEEEVQDGAYNAFAQGTNYLEAQLAVAEQQYDATVEEYANRIDRLTNPQRMVIDVLGRVAKRRQSATPMPSIAGLLGQAWGEPANNAIALLPASVGVPAQV